MEAWKRVSQSEIDDWRKKVKEDLKTKRGTRYEYNTAYHTGFERGTPEEAKSGTATMVAPKTATGIRQHRDTVEVATRSMIDWAKEDKASFMHRVRILKKQGNMSHLTDEEAANRLWEICHKLSEESAQRVYKRDGYDHRFWRG